MPDSFRTRPAPRPHRTPRGVTLLELLVVLVLLGIAAAVVAPVLRVPPRADAGDTLQRVVADARALAVRRAESLVLDVAPDGAWTLATRDAALVAQGRVEAAATSSIPARLVVTALGACVPDPSPNAAPGSALDAAWDPAACRPAVAAATGAR